MNVPRRVSAPRSGRKWPRRTASSTPDGWGHAAPRRPRAGPQRIRCAGRNRLPASRCDRQWCDTWAIESFPRRNRLWFSRLRRRSRTGRQAPRINPRRRSRSAGAREQARRSALGMRLRSARSAPAVRRSLANRLLAAVTGTETPWLPSLDPEESNPHATSSRHGRNSLRPRAPTRVARETAPRQ